MKQLMILGAVFTASFSFGQLPSKNCGSVTEGIKLVESTERSTQEKWQRARIYYTSNDQLALLASQGLALDHGKKKPGVYFESDFTENQLAIARMIGCEVEVLIDDVKAYYVEGGKAENLKPKNLEEKNTACTSGGSSGVPAYNTPSNWELGSMGGFYTYNEILAELDQMASLYPNLITVKSAISTFQTEEGRSIYWVKISDNPNTDEAEPEMLYDAVHHAREPAAVQQLIYFMWYLLENYNTNTEIKGIVDNTELYFIPVLNPDGYQYNCTQDPNGGGMWRKNRRNNGGGKYGVDNNRNYHYVDGNSNEVWNTTGVSSNPSDDTYPGTSYLSEVENQAMKWFCENHDFRMALNNHTYDNSLLHPYGYDYNKYTPEEATYVAIADMMVLYNGLGMNSILSSALYPASGDSDDWGYGADLATKPRIFSFTPEIGNNSHGFWPNINDIEDLCNSMMWTNITAAHLITNYAKTEDASEYTVADLTGYFKYTIQRLGLEDPSNFTISMNPISSNIISFGSSNDHNGMTILQSDLDSISYSLDPSILPGELIQYEILIDNGYYTESIDVEKIYGVGDVIFSDNGNNLNNWTVSQTWGSTAEDYYSASSSITDSPGSNYNNGINKTITLSNTIDLSIALSATVSFYAKWDVENNYDYVQFEVSTNGGSTWEPQCGNYTNTGTSDQDQGKPLYDGTQSSWVKEEINLSDYLGSTIKFRFKIISDNFVNGDGFYFDDFEVNVIEASSQSINWNEVLISGYPNPASNSFFVEYDLSNTSIENGDLILMDNLGQVVNVITLNGEKGRLMINTETMVAGVYYYQIQGSTNKSQVKKLIITK
ncbi:MAG: immune inhibitor A [Flavobacteriales bacterium]|nr:immune inhibitor A [Flavobacteriales bacterium]MCB9198709.1 immune inhibitor A [Flavobacteriales bacterium]